MQTFPAGRGDILVPLEILLQSVNQHFGLFVTPTFEGAKDFPWINKPCSIQYFLEHAASELKRNGETVIAILDPDFIFMKPLTQTELQADDLLTSAGILAKDGINVAKRGKPVGQRYMYGWGWLDKVPVTRITNGLDIEPRTKFPTVGPPYILHVEDATNLSKKWRDYMIPVLKNTPGDILTDMYAYAIAAAELKLEHTILDQYMISTHGTHLDIGEGHPFLGKWMDAPFHSCSNPDYIFPESKVPNYIHWAQNFQIDGYSLHKGHVPADILDCNVPFIIVPEDKNDEDEHTRTERFLICNIIYRLNRLLKEYKDLFCPNEYEKRHLIHIIGQTTVSCDTHKDKWCWPFAQIEGLPKDWRTDAE